MSKNRKLWLGWMFIVVNGLYLAFGLVTNDMGGIVDLGYNPDVPLSFDAAPGRFLSGILLYGAIVVIGIKMVREAEMEGLKDLKEAGADQSVLTLRYYEALAKVADGQATKIIIPSDMASVASVATSIAEIVKALRK